MGGAMRLRAIAEIESLLRMVFSPGAPFDQKDSPSASLLQSPFALRGEWARRDTHLRVLPAFSLRSSSGERAALISAGGVTYFELPASLCR